MMLYERTKWKDLAAGVVVAGRHGPPASPQAAALRVTPRHGATSTRREQQRPNAATTLARGCKGVWLRAVQHAKSMRMAAKDILIWPNPELLKVSQKVDAIDDSIKALVQDMFDAMYAADGVGLAAPQIGVHKRVVVVDIRSYEREQEGKRVEIPSGEEPLVLINPVISNKSGELEWEEGCLSVPGETGMVTRAAKCTVTYQDLTGATH